MVVSVFVRLGVMTSREGHLLGVFATRKEMLNIQIDHLYFSVLMHTISVTRSMLLLFSTQ